MPRYTLIPLPIFLCLSLSSSLSLSLPSSHTLFPSLLVALVMRLAFFLCGISRRISVTQYISVYTAGYHAGYHAGYLSCASVMSLILCNICFVLLFCASVLCFCFVLIVVQQYLLCASSCLYVSRVSYPHDTYVS